MKGEAAIGDKDKKEHKQKAVSLGKINRINKPLARLIRKKIIETKHPADVKRYFQPHIIFDFNIK